MHSSAILLALQCSLCLAIRVPIVWNDNSEVNDDKQFETVKPQAVDQKPIPVEYFQYTAQKPKFAAEIAKFHGVQSPENHYKAYPVKPHTGVPKPELGKHQLLDHEKKIYRPLQKYVNRDEVERYVTPSSTSYEVFHPYKLEEPALKELYQDPVLDKIRNDLQNSKNRLQKYENEAGEADIKKDEYLESPDETDRKKFAQRNVPVPYEIHRPQRRPVYYRPPSIPNHRDQVLNQKFRHPWHQHYVKVKPMHYRPVKNHLQRLRQQHALKYDDERNEYPQVLPEKYSEPSDGYDIYEKGKAKFVQLRNNVDESINEAVQKNRPKTVNQKLELNNENSNEQSNIADDEVEFIPIKNYAQVRKTETTKHLPKEAALRDADTLDEILNAPRLREAVKSTKAQTVYSEEGYEDSAYDHAGEQKHASENEGHGGFLKEKELSGGKYKTPTFSAKYKDEDSSEYRDQVLDGKKWKDNNKDTAEETESEDYSENEQEYSSESEIYTHEPKKNKSDESKKSEEENNNSSQAEEIDRIKREKTPDNSDDTSKNTENSDKNIEHDVNKREAKIEVPEINLNTTYLSEKDILKLAKVKIVPKIEKTTEKYPYYNKKLSTISKDSPLRYAENLLLIPKKSAGGTEFYDSRSKLECPEVDDNVDPIPEKIKKGGHPDENDDDEDEDDETDVEKKDKADFSGLEEKPRLNGLGDKIDCFKAKYFGENPLDSPFFQEEIISNPEPVTIPSIDIYKLKQAKEQTSQEPKLNKTSEGSDELQEKAKINMFELINKLYPKTYYNDTPDISTEIRQFKPEFTKQNVLKSQGNVEDQNNKTQILHQNKDLLVSPKIVRNKRATPFVYEPYKIIRDGQVPDSKKTTTTNNISPLIKQLQSSRIVDRVATNQGKDQVVKRNANTKTYKDIGRNDREKNIGKEKGSQPIYDTSFVDVSVDQRRGEPKYELRPVNHKSQYTPVENKKSMTMEDYKAHTNSEVDTQDSNDNKKASNQRQTKTTSRPYFDVSKFLPNVEEPEVSASSNARNKNNTETHPSTDDPSENSESEEEYDEYDNNYDDDHLSTTTTTTTTTTKAPSRRRRITTTTTTVKPQRDDEKTVTDVPRLRLITRFRDSYQTDKPKVRIRIEKPTTKRYDIDEEIIAPKYREKKKKTSKTTLVTDTKSYGDNDDDDLRKEEVDALIGVKQDNKEYMPEYEKRERKKDSAQENLSKSQDDDEDEDNDDSGEVDHNHEDDDDDDDDEDENDEEENEDDDEEESEEEPKIESTTPEPSKRTLTRTTEAPLTTTEARSAKLEVKPVVVKKKIEIHKELPVNRSSPHITEFKQDIKEVEIIKELPPKTKKKQQKNIEALELYKDENLAKDVNKLGGVEVFKEGLDLANGPKHGGNYRSAEDLTEKSPSLPLRRKENQKSLKGDVVASQSKTSKLIDVKSEPFSRRRSDIQRAGNYRGRSAKLIELSDSNESTTSRSMHGGNFKSIQNDRRRGGSRNAKLIELDDHDSREDHSTNSQGDDYKPYGSRGGDRSRMHGGNYRSAKLVQSQNSKDKEREENVEKQTKKDGRRDAALFLSSIANAVPILTSTPAYILDPSKRMYYYVDA